MSTFSTLKCLNKKIIEKVDEVLAQDILCPIENTIFSFNTVVCMYVSLV